MTQREQVINALRKLGGYATLRDIYKNVDTGGWRTQTPTATIRRIVQDYPDFIKLKPGLWGLHEAQESFADLIDKRIPRKQQAERDHYYYQGLLLETGNSRGYETFAPNQDKNRPFLHTTLGVTRSLAALPSFTYPKTLQRAKTIDVIWFNQRKMPCAFFEVEHTTNFINSMNKYLALQDFRAHFYVVADEARRNRFATSVNRDEYSNLQVKFLNYEELARWHAVTGEASFLNIP